MEGNHKINYNSKSRNSNNNKIKSKHHQVQFKKLNNDNIWLKITVDIRIAGK